MTKLFAGSLIKGMDFTHQQNFCILVYFPHNGVHSEITAVVLLSGIAKFCCGWHVLRDMSQWHAPLTWPQRTSAITWERLTCAAASPILGVAHFPRAPYHPVKLFTASLSQTRAGLTFLANTGSKTEICNFILPPPLSPPHLWSSWLVAPALASGVEVSKLIKFRENHLRTQNLLSALGCCQTSVLNRGWRIHTGAQPCQEIRGRPSVFDSQLTEMPVSLF